MKKIFLFASIIILLFSCGVKKAAMPAAPRLYEVTMDGKTKILKGIINRSLIENDSSFKWFKQNYNLGTVDMPAVNAFKKNGSKFQMVIFGGTWCEDTQNLLPSFFRLVDKSNYSENNIILIGVDRDKTTLGSLNKAFNITNVPTFIVMKNGKEIARVVEYGKYGKIDKELGEIVAGL